MSSSLALPMTSVSVVKTSVTPRQKKGHAKKLFTTEHTEHTERSLISVCSVISVVKNLRNFGTKTRGTVHA